MSGPEAVSGTGPGRAAYEAFWANRPPVTGLATAIPADWDREEDAKHRQWDAAAQAAIKHAVSASHDGCAAVIAGLETDRDSAREQRDGAYRERARLVAFAAACYPAVMLTDAAEPDWPIVFVDTPAGQLSWHVAATDTDLFQHVPSTTEPTWDGHTTEVKYERLADMTDRLARSGGVAGIVAATVKPDPQPAPELAAAMAETRQLREHLAALAVELEAEAAKDETARENARDGISRLLLERRAEWCRWLAAKLNALSGVVKPTQRTISVSPRLPEPDESREAYGAYLDGLFAPVRAEVDRLRAGTAIAAAGTEHLAGEGT